MCALNRWRCNRWLLVVSRLGGLGIALGIPTITLYWEQQGIKKSEMFLLQIIFALGLIVLEVATGQFADRYGKVLTLRLAAGTQMVGCLNYSIADSFADFLIAELVFALGIALASGTDEAFLYQTCKALNRPLEHQRWWSRITSSGFWFMAMLVASGGWIASFGLSVPYWVASFLGVLSVTATALMVEPPKDVQSEQVVTAGTARLAWQALFCANPALRWMVLAPGLVGALNQPFVWTYPDYLVSCGLRLEQLGFAFALFNIVAALSAWNARRLRAVSAEIMATMSLFILLAVSTFGLSLAAGFWAWLFILPQQIIRSYSGLLFSTSINAAVPDEIRASALSVRNAIRSSQYVLGLAIWWYFVDQIGFQGMLVVSFALALIGLVAVALGQVRQRFLRSDPLEVTGTKV